jgi:hypothetical protein
VATYIIHQQFFRNPDMIMDRRRKKTVKVKGSEIIIKKMIALLLTSVDLWDKDEEESFLQVLCKNLKLQNTKIQQKYHEKIDPIMAHEQINQSLKLMLAYSVVITEIQQKATRKVLSEIRKSLKEKISTKKINAVIDNLSEQGNVDFSLLINLGILQAYAKLAKEPIPEKEYKKYQTKIATLIEKETKAN